MHPSKRKFKHSTEALKIVMSNLSQGGRSVETTVHMDTVNSSTAQRSDWVAEQVFRSTQ